MVMRDVAELADGTVLHAEVGIVGAGFAGIDLARYLGRHGVRVVLLESGRLAFDPETQKLTQLDSVGKTLKADDEGVNACLPPDYRGQSRIRQFGGTSNSWTGKWKPLVSLDFEARPWIPYTGWPIRLADLKPYYDEVAREYGLEDFEGFRASTLANSTRELLGGKGELKLSIHFKQKETIRLAKTFLEEFGRAAQVEVVLGANATEIVLDGDLHHVRAIVFQSLDRRRFTLSARRFVLAAGGLEVPRLLLASNRQIPAGVGNGRGLVGRFYMDHPKQKRGVLWAERGAARLPSFVGPEPRPIPHFRVDFSPSDRMQRAHSLLNHTIYLAPAYCYQLDYPTQAARALRAALRTADTRLLSAAWALVVSPRDLWKVIQRTAYRDRGGPIAHYVVSTMYLEQAPNPDSRVHLGSERDVLGMPKLVMDWRFAPIDREVFPRFLTCFAEAFAGAAIGRLDFGPEAFTIDDTFDASHHMGTTRMAASPDTGVVDRNCRVFGTENLFVASSSVFPSGGNANPTFTIVALARRLGAHLRELCERRGSARALARDEAA